MKRRLLRLYSALHARYGPQGWWPARSAFEVAMGAVLTQHTAWPGAARVMANLHAARRLEARRLAALSPAALSRLIRPAGTWRFKAGSLLALAKFLLERAGGRLEQAVATIPFRRAAQPTEIADWVWMLSQGTYMTGETIVISGGLIVR